jgi:hypothetical protein
VPRFLLRSFRTKQKRKQQMRANKNALIASVNGYHFAWHGAFFSSRFCLLQAFIKSIEEKINCDSSKCLTAGAFVSSEGGMSGKAKEWNH